MGDGAWWGVTDARRGVRDMRRGVLITKPGLGVLCACSAFVAPDLVDTIAKKLLGVLRVAGGGGGEGGGCVGGK